MRKKFLLLGMSVMMLFGVIGCSSVNDLNDYPEQKSVHLRQINLENRKDLYYDDETGIVYFLFNLGYGQNSKGYMSSYYSKNGKLCKYENGQIMEIMEEK